MKEGHEIFERETTLSFFSDRKLEKCLSSYQINSFRNKSSEKLNEFQQSSGGLTEKKQKDSLNNEFLFCLKLKMIGISSVLGYRQTQYDKIEAKDANQILNELSRQIKSYQKQSAKKQSQLQTFCKQQQIQILNYQSKIKQMQSQQNMNKKQVQRIQKSNTLGMQKIQKRVNQLEEDKYELQQKLIFINEIAKQQSKKVQLLRLENKEFQRKNKELQSKIFQKQKEIARITSDAKVEKNRIQTQCQGFKTSIMKKVQQVQQLQKKIAEQSSNFQQTNLKLQICQSNSHKTQCQLQKSNSSLSYLTQRYDGLLCELNSKKMEYQNNLTAQRFKLEQQNKSIIKIENICNLHSESLNMITKDIKKMEIQFISISNFVQKIQQQFELRLKQIEEAFLKQEALLKEELEIQRRELIMDLERFYRDEINRLEDQVFDLSHQLKKL